MGEHLVDAIEVSIVIPVYNEATIVGPSLRELCTRLQALGLRFEVVVAENGSVDATVAAALAVVSDHPQVTVFSYPEPNYGGALREGIFRARGRYVVCEEIDLCDVAFLERALEKLRADEADLVVGSKAMAGAHDTRPLKRRVATLVYNRVLRLSLGFRGTDTHGLKAFWRDRLLPVVSSCVVEHDVFASELVIRAERGGLRVREIPTAVAEKRAPSVRLFARVPRVLKNLARLFASIHLSEPGPHGRGLHDRGTGGIDPKQAGDG